jgi:acetyl esterase/lipase
VPAPDPELLRGIVASLRLDADDVAEQRAGLEAGADATPLPDGVEVQAAELAGLPAETIVAAGTAPSSAVLVVHGGGYCIGSVNAERYFAARLALATRAEVWTFAYRLAPEHPFPAAFDDTCRAAAALPAACGRPPARIGLVGESAGGGLVLAALVDAARRGRSVASTAAVVSPWVDLTLSGESLVTNDGRDLVVTRPATERWASWYLAGADPRDVRASPLLADLRGLPPLLVQVGGDEVLLSDARRVADRAEAAGVEVTCSVWPGNSHVFSVYPPEVGPDSTAGVDELAAFLAGELGRGG